VNLPLFIARRYFLSKRKKNFINIISLLSMGVVAFATAALVVVLSVFNGLGDLLRSINRAFDPQIKIEAVQGKSFLVPDSLLNAIKKTEGVAVVTEVIEDYVLARYEQPNVILPEEEIAENEQHYLMPKGTAEMIVTMKGVSSSFVDDNRFDGYLQTGTLQDLFANKNSVLVGKGVRNILSIIPENKFVPVQLFYVKSLKANSFNPASLYTQELAMPVGIFSIEGSIDNNYVFVPLELARDLMNYGNKRTALEIKLHPDADEAATQNKLKELLGNSFNVLTNDEQHQDLLRIVNMEKLFAGLALVILISIASINIFFSLMMLVIDKKKDISILAAMGATPQLIRNIFIAEAFVISGIGAVSGLLLGAILCWLQENVGLVGMGMETSLLMNYPVKMIATDFIYVGSVILLITWLIARFPARVAAKGIEVRTL
jgi:lipoprotein-releasing system permease protein